MQTIALQGLHNSEGVERSAIGRQVEGSLDWPPLKIGSMCTSFRFLETVIRLSEYNIKRLGKDWSSFLHGVSHQIYFWESCWVAVVTLVRNHEDPGFHSRSRDFGYVLLSSPMLGRNGRYILPDSQWRFDTDQFIISFKILIRFKWVSNSILPCRKHH